MKPTKKYYENFAKQAIMEALLHLMEEKKFEKISITEIANEAAIARRTFYLYYNSKFDVLNDYYNVLIREYDDNLEGELSIDSMEQVKYFFNFWKEHRRYLEILYNQKLFYVLLNGFSKYIDRRVAPTKACTSREYNIAYSSGGLWAVLYIWTEAGFKTSPDELASVVFGMQRL